MKIKYFSLLLAAVLLLSLPDAAAAAADNADNGIAAVKVSPDMYINDNFALISGYNINGNTYYKLRDLAVYFNSTSLKFDVVWNSEENAVEILTDKEYSDFYADTAWSIETGGYVINNKKNFDFYAAITTDTPTAYKSNSALLVDGKIVNVTAYNIENNNFYMLRDLGEALGFEVNWNGAENRIDIYFLYENSQISERTGTDTSH